MTPGCPIPHLLLPAKSAVKVPQVRLDPLEGMAYTLWNYRECSPGWSGFLTLKSIAGNLDTCQFSSRHLHLSAPVPACEP